MPLDLRFTVASDRKSVTIEVDEGVLDAAGIEELIATLMDARANLDPRMPAEDPIPGTRVLTSSEARWYMAPRPDGLTLLGIMHPGFGWVGIHLDVEGAAALSAQVVRAAAVSQRMQQAHPDPDPSPIPPLSRH